jgi:Transposase
VLTEAQDNEAIVERVAALDIGKAELVCCVRVPDAGCPGRRMQEVVTYSAMTRPLLGMADRLACLGVTRVVMEATSDYWKPVFYLLEAAGFETWLVNAKDVKHLPGRPKTAGPGVAWPPGNLLLQVGWAASVGAWRSSTICRIRSCMGGGVTPGILRPPSFPVPSPPVRWCWAGPRPWRWRSSGCGHSGRDLSSG